MNLYQKLAVGQSKQGTLEIIRYIGDDKDRFKELMNLVFGKDPLLSQRAAWPMSYVGIEHPQLVTPYFHRLIQTLAKPTHHPAVSRNILRLFQDIEVPEKYRGALFDICFSIIPSEREAIANRAFSISIVSHLCVQYPDLKREFLILLNTLQEQAHAPAISVRIKYALKELRKLEPKI